MEFNDRREKFLTCQRMYMTYKNDKDSADKRQWGREAAFYLDKMGGMAGIW